MITTRGTLGLAFFGAALAAGCVSSGRHGSSNTPQFAGSPTATIFVKGVT